MPFLTGPRMYYSMFGAKGLFLGAKCRFLRRPVQVVVRPASLVNPVWLRLRTTDVDLCRQMVFNEWYACDLSRPPSVIVDAGANIGLFSVSYASKYPEAKIFAIEPESSNFEMLTRNAAPYPNITPIRAALWNENTELNLVDPGFGHTTYQTRGDSAPAASNRQSLVPAITVDRLMSTFNISFIDLLKVNIEGAEKEVFESASRWISRVGVIAMDFHDHLRPGSSAPARAATHDFELTWKKGAITFWAKKDFASGKPSGSAHSKAVLRILKSETLPS